MWRGVFYILGACLCWSGVFVIPKFITGFTALEISLGRFFCFGMISTIGLLVKKRKLLTKTWGSIWKKALWLGFISTIGCYTATVLCIQYASPKVANLLFGLVPILVAIFGNHRKKEYSFRVIALPCAFIGIGIVLCNIEAFSLEGESLSSYIFGFFMGLLSLFCWVWYVLACFDFMKKNSHVTSSDWVLMTGGTVFCLATAIGGTVVGIEGLERYLALDLVSWIIGSLVLGGISSWLATYFWTQGNLHLPIALVGQLAVFEMIFALIVLYIVEHRMPRVIEAVAIGLMVIGVLQALRSFERIKKAIS